MPYRAALMLLLHLRIITDIYIYYTFYKVGAADIAITNIVFVVYDLKSRFIINFDETNKNVTGILYKPKYNYTLIWIMIFRSLFFICMTRTVLPVLNLFKIVILKTSGIAWKRSNFCLAGVISIRDSDSWNAYLSFKNAGNCPQRRLFVRCT